MSTDKERHALMAKGRSLFDSCSPENEYACVMGYLVHNQALGGWRAEVIDEFIGWLRHERAAQTRQGEHAAAILQKLDNNE